MATRNEQMTRAMALDSAVRWAVSTNASKVVNGIEFSLRETDILDLADRFADYINNGRD